jgi:hypothetical protein
MTTDGLLLLDAVFFLLLFVQWCGHLAVARRLDRLEAWVGEVCDRRRGPQQGEGDQPAPKTDFACLPIREGGQSPPGG